MDPYYSEDLIDLSVKIANWRAEKGFDTHWKNVPEKLMLIVTELAEAMEAYRHLNDKTLNALLGGSCIGQINLYFDQIKTDQLPVVDNFIEEIADTFIRMFDLSGSLGIDLSRAVAKKMAKNEKRPYLHGKER